jgi:hypothetical protein
MRAPAPRDILPPDERLLPPRYAPQRQLPPYRYVPGRAPHPTADPAGHSFGHDEPAAVRMAPEQWRRNEPYLFGVDLFNRRFYWEAHEAWEAVWHTCDKTATQGLFIQGLIQIAAALLRWHMGTERGARKLYAEGRAKLEPACRESPREYMGLAVAGWLEALDSVFAQLLLWPERAPEMPVIRLLR